MNSLVALGLVLASQASAKSFQNSYVSFDVPENWNCAQEGVAWTCTPLAQPDAKQAVIVVAAKVAGPEDSVPNFVNYLRQPRRITTKVGTPMPSQVMYSQQRTLAGTTWVQAQHVSSEIQDYYTLYLATVKEQLAILVSFSAEKNNYAKYNPVFDTALKTLKITADQHVLFPKGRNVNKAELVGIQVPGGDLSGGPGDIPVPTKNKSGPWPAVGAFTLILGAVGFLVYRRGRRPKRRGSSHKSRR